MNVALYLSVQWNEHIASRRGRLDEQRHFKRARMKELVNIEEIFEIYQIDYCTRIWYI